MRRLSIMLAAALLQTEGGAFAQEPSQPAEAPMVQKLSGNPRIWRSGKPAAEALKDIERIYARDCLGTDDGRPAGMLVGGDLRLLIKGVTVGPEKGIGIERDGQEKIVLRLSAGTAAVDSSKMAFDVKTPGGILTTKPGYALLTASEDGKSIRIVVVDGRPTFSNDKGSVELEPGQMTVAEKEKAPEKPKAVDLRRELEWVLREEAQMNLILSNSSFEAGTEGWTMSLKELTAVFEEGAGAAHSGKRASRLQFKQERLDPHMPPERSVELVEGKWYRLMIWVRTERFTVDGKPGLLRLKVDSDKPDGDVLSPDPVSCEGKWKLLQMSFRAKDGNGRIRLYEDGIGARAFDGTIWTDDWMLTPAPPPLK